MGNRRQILKGLAATGGMVLLSPGMRAATVSMLRDFPFRCGVASGYPAHDSVVLWTRLAPNPEQPGGGMPPQDYRLRFELASDEAFRKIVKRGEATADARFAHSVHHEVKGLRPARDYWYRFIAGDHVSSIGRTRTLPAPRDAVDSFRIVVASCQNYEHAYYAAWRHMAANAPHLVLFVGDYIYDNTSRGPRKHTGGNAQTLEDYRQRYTQYRSDAALQAAHAVAPWCAVWDDHEVVNDYAGTLPGREDGDPAAFLVKRAAAYQAWYEHLPVPPSMAPRDGVMRIHSRTHIGRLATLHLLDQRQYRSPEACPRPPQLGGMRVGNECTERIDPARTMLGVEQERWFEQGLKQGATWTVVAQGTPFTQVNQGSRDKPEYAMDMWSGYPAARQRLLDALQRARATNPVFTAGDIHAFLVGGVNAVPEQPDSPLLGAEFVATSISSNPLAQATLDKWVANGPPLKKVDGTHRGYLAFTLSPKQLRADLVGVDDAQQAESPSRVMDSYVVEAGRPDIQPA
jgi:alkaline phosphatase D